MSNKPKAESKVRKSRRKQKNYGRGDGFTMDDLVKDRNSDKEREARKFEKRYGRYGRAAGFTLLELLGGLVAFCIIMMLALTCSGCSQRDLGIIKLEGYSQAVAFCDGGGDIKPEPLKFGWGDDVATQYRKDGILVVINPGWEHHPSNEALFNLAVQECKKQFQKE